MRSSTPNANCTAGRPTSTSRPATGKPCFELHSAPEQRLGSRPPAFTYLKAFHHDVIPLLPELFLWAVKSQRWAKPAREIIAGIRRDQRTPLLEPLFMNQLAAAEDDDYPNLASLAALCEAWPLLERLVRQAENHNNPDVREVIEHYNQTYSPMWQKA